MKTAMISTIYEDKEYPYQMLETLEDVNEYSEQLDRGMDKTINRVLTSEAPPDRWDHLAGRDEQGGLLMTSYMYAKLRGTNPLMEMGTIKCNKVINIEKLVLAGDTVLINEVGGYCPFSEGYHIMGEQTEKDEMIVINIVINENTKYINLENDPDLEQHTIDYLSEVDPNFSYVCGLRDWNKDDLVRIFKEFQKNGGEVVYVYTTGMDVPQMYEYSAAIIRSGIKKVEFEFNAGYTLAFDDVIETLQAANVEVNLIGHEEFLE